MRHIADDLTQDQKDCANVLFNYINTYHYHGDDISIDDIELDPKDDLGYVFIYDNKKYLVGTKDDIINWVDQDLWENSYHEFFDEVFDELYRMDSEILLDYAHQSGKYEVTLEQIEQIKKSGHPRKVINSDLYKLLDRDAIDMLAQENIADYAKYSYKDYLGSPLYSTKDYFVYKVR
jgi:hypothetical protein